MKVPVNVLCLLVIFFMKPAIAQGQVDNDALFFRDLFRSSLGDAVSRDQFDRISLLPTPDIYPDPSAPDLENYARRVSQRSPDQLYAYTRQHQPTTQHYDLKAMLDPAFPLTMVFFPGFGEEICVTSVFEDVMGRQTSAEALRFKRAMANKNKPGAVSRYDIAIMRERQTTLDEVMRVGSIDDASGHPLIVVIYLFPVFGSLESLGGLHPMVQHYRERMDRYFALMGLPSRLYLAGHSMGANRALDLLATVAAAPTKPDWYSSLKGVITLNGALFGTDFVVATKEADSRPGQIYKQLQRVLELNEDHSMSAWVDNTLQQLSIALHLGYEFIFKPEGLSSKEVSYLSRARNIVGLAAYLESKLPAFYTSSNKGDSSYIIKRLKVIVQAIFTAFDDVSPAKRLDWWRSSLLPPHLLYVNISSTMPSLSGEQDSWPGRGRLTGWNTPDYELFRGMYYDAYPGQQVSLNDGLVGVQQSVMQPALHMQLNSAQSAYTVHWLGILGIHHGGTAFASVMDDNPARFNHFPRGPLLRSIAAFVRQKERTAFPPQPAKS